MKRILPFALILALPGCSLGALMQPPATYANATVLDDKIALAIELGYQATAQAILLANDLRPFSPELRDRVKAADRKAYEAVLAVRAAYRAGNANSYAMAAAEAQAAVAALLQLIGG